MHRVYFDFSSLNQIQLVFPSEWSRDSLHYVLLRSTAKGQPFLLWVLGAIKYLFFWFTPQTEDTSGNISLQWPSYNLRLATDYWRWWPLVIWVYAANCTRLPRKSKGGGGSQAHPQGERNYFLSINQNGHTLSGGSFNRNRACSSLKRKQAEIDFLVPYTYCACRMLDILLLYKLIVQYFIKNLSRVH